MTAERASTRSRSTSPAPVFRAPMRSLRADVPDGIAVEHALRTGVCGMGGSLHGSPSDLAEAVRLAADQYDERMARRIGRLADAPVGSFVWTRDADGLFWLGRLTGAWRYDPSAEAAAVDLVHVRSCRWLEAPTPEHLTPPAVRATFARGGRNWQRVHAASVHEETTRIWQAATRRRT